MKPLLEFFPHVGVGPVCFGMSPKKVISVLENLGFSVSQREPSVLHFTAENALQVEFIARKCTFIGAFSSSLFEVRVCGIDPFANSAEDVFATIAGFESKPHAFSQDEYFFPDAIITLWDASEQYNSFDQTGRAFWAQVGLGNEKYVEAINSRSWRKI